MRCTSTIKKLKWNTFSPVFCQCTSIKTNWVTLVLWNIEIWVHSLFGRSVVKSGCGWEALSSLACGLSLTRLQTVATQQNLTVTLKKNLLTWIVEMGRGEERHLLPLPAPNNKIIDFCFSCHVKCNMCCKLKGWNMSSQMNNQRKYKNKIEELSSLRNPDQ